MIICRLLLFPLVFVLEVVIPIIEEIVSTICGWISSIIEVIKEVVSKICGWLPWPFNKLCKWVVDLITVFETVWDWVCETIIETIITFIKHVLNILVFITRWICILISFVTGFIPYLLCRLGLSNEKTVRICIKVLTDEKGNTKVNPEAIKKSMDTMSKIYGQCKIKVQFTGIEYIEKPEYLTGTGCGFGNIFTYWHSWFSSKACTCCNQITVFFVDEIEGASGCAIPGDNWCRVDAGINYDSTIIAHEVGHLLNLWSHSDDPNNLMFGEFSTTSFNLTTHQCCTMRMSPFVTNF